MCLVLFAWQAHSRYELVLVANRDEFHERPSAAADYWPDYPDLLAGRDLQAGGTWMGVSRAGRFAAITNYREPVAPEIPLEQSRGFLVRDFLAGSQAPMVAAEELAGVGSQYRGFNLLLGAPGELAYVSNRGAGPVQVEPGVHGLSNHLLDTDWPKVHHGCERLSSSLKNDGFKSEALFDLMGDRNPIGGALPGGVEPSLAPEDLIRHYFIRSPVYGTRCTTVLLIDRDGPVRFEERRFDSSGQGTGASIFELEECSQ